ncbi:DUF11 domain-containing protein, partial [Streptomyces sp. SBT349]|uniref:DUF11 domain-containing protein n=1 Tax=Streptomyces sp. SBT349 TaxID=1580539 RepID=UPI00066D19EE
MARLPDLGPGGRLCAAVLALVLIATGTVLTQSLGAPASASPNGTAAPGRIAYGGTLHRSMGTVEEGTTGSSTPLFPDGPQHYDDEASALGDTVVWTSLRDAPLPQVYLREGAGPVVRLTENAEGVQHPVLSPDGGRVAFAASTGSEDGGRDIWVVDADGSDPRRVTDGLGENAWPTWSPDGEQLAFAGRRGPGGGWQIYRVPAEGGAIAQLTDDSVDEELADTEVLGNIQPAWDPVAEHDRILITCHRPSTEAGEAAVLKWIPTSGSMGTTGVELFPGRDSRQGSWSPDGDSVAFVSHSPPEGDPEAPDMDRVYTADVALDGTAGTPELRLDEDRRLATPTWYPAADGDARLLVTRTSAATASTMNLMDVRADGADPRDLGVSLRDVEEDRAYGYDLSDVSQAYSPDGRSLAFTRVTYDDSGRSSRVWLADADGSDPRPLPDEDALPTTSTGQAAWSPDGSRIALTRSCLPCLSVSRVAVVEVATGAEVYEIDASVEESDSDPAYSPDGASLVFTRETGQAEEAAVAQEATTHLWSAAAADGTGLRDLTAVDDPDGSRDADSHPAYAPDGSTLALVAGGRLGLVGSDGTGPRNVPDPDSLCDPEGTASYTCANPTWSPDGGRLAANARQEAPATGYDPDPFRQFVTLVDPATGTAQRITGTGFRGMEGDDGQQVDPTWQRTSDLHTELVTPPEPVTVGDSGDLGLTVTNLGPVAVPDAVLTISVPGSLLPAGAEPGTGTCAADLTCRLGTLEPDQVVPVDLTVTGTGEGTFPVTWTVGGALPDPDESDNQGGADVVVTPPDPGPEPTPPPD